MILMSVDLPAPFSPTSACTSPRSTSTPTPSSATTPEKTLRIPSIRRSGSLVISVQSSERFAYELRGVRLVEEAILIDDLRRNLLAALELLKRVEGNGAEARVALDRRVHVA